MYFPLREPICVHRGSTLEVHFWRCCDSTKVGFLSFVVFHRISVYPCIYSLFHVFQYFVESKTGLV
jgi:hypothetical protein